MAPGGSVDERTPLDVVPKWYQRWPSVMPLQPPTQTPFPISSQPQNVISDAQVPQWPAYNNRPYPQFPNPGQPRAHISATGKGVLIGMLSVFGSVVLILLVLGIVYFFKYTSRGRILLDRIGRPGEFDDEQAFAKEEAEALEEMEDIQRAEYMRAKAFIQSNPPESTPTDISLSQFLAIQEKGVSAWEFEPELEIANCFVEGRTEVEFFDSECSVQSNLPVPKQNEVYYWEAKIYDKPETTVVGVGMTTKPYPLFRLPGFHKTSVAYLSPGHKRFNQPFNPVANYGPPFVRGDVVGVGYRPRTGTVFFTRNGKKLEDVTHSLKTQNLFPTVGSTGPATIHVNFGQMGFVYIEANVKKWGLAPMTGSLAPPPPYGSEQGSILLEGADRGVPDNADSPDGDWSYGHGRSRSSQYRMARGHQTTSPGPHRSPTDISLAQLSLVDSQDGLGEDEINTSITQYNRQGHPNDPNNAHPITSQQTLTVEGSPPPEYSSPFLEQGAAASGSSGRGYFDMQHHHARSPSHSRSRAQRHKRRKTEPQQGSSRGIYREHDFERPGRFDAEQGADEMARAVQHSNGRVTGTGDEPSPPIPSYDAAVGLVSPPDEPSSSRQGENTH